MKKPDFYKYSIFAPKVRKDIAKKEKKLAKRGIKLTNEQKSEIRKKIIKRYRIRASILGAIAAVGITGYNINKTKMLEAPKKQVEISDEQKSKEIQESAFKSSLQVDGVKVYLNEEAETVIDEIAYQYNEKNNEDITKESIGIIKSTPEYLGENYKVDNQDEDIIYRNGDRYSTRFGPVYSIVNKEEKEIIGSICELDGEIVNVTVDNISAESDKGEKTEYTKSNKSLDLTLDNKGNKRENIKGFYKDIEKEYEEKVKNLEKNISNESEIDDNREL